MSKYFLLLFAVGLWSWGGKEMAMLRHKEPLAVQCSRIATLAGCNPYEKSGTGWRNIIKSNFRPLYDKLTEQDRGLRTKEDTAAYEKKQLKPEQKALLRKLTEEAIAAPKAKRVDAKRHGLNVSTEVAKQLESEVKMQRGTLGERKGLKAAEAAEKRRASQQKAQSDRLQRGAKLLTLQNDAISQMQDLLEALRKQDEAVAEALLKSDLVAVTALLPRRQVKTMAKAMAAESQKLRKAAAKRATPFEAGNTKMYSAEVAPGLILRGKIDAHRQTCDEGHPSIDIFEHKARQRRLFKTLKQYEKIQCLGYIDLVKRHSDDAGVRCFLVETFQGATWQCEVKEEPVLWQEQILRVVSKRADELRDLMRADTPSQVVKEWLDNL